MSIRSNQKEGFTSDMVTKCKFCDFSYTAELDIDLLKKAARACNRQIVEDMVLFMGKLFKDGYYHDYNGVKIHMGKMHKDDNYYGISPDYEFSDFEKQIIDSST